MVPLSFLILLEYVSTHLVNMNSWAYFVHTFPLFAALRPKGPPPSVPPQVWGAIETMVRWSQKPQLGPQKYTNGITRVYLFVLTEQVSHFRFGLTGKFAKR